MQEALPYKRWDAMLPSNNASTLHGIVSGSIEDQTSVIVKFVNIVKENPVVVLGRRGCCMCHVVRKLLLGLGVNPPMFEVDVDLNETLLLNSLFSEIMLVNEEKSNKLDVNVNNMQFPLVFVGGKLFGGLDKVMATHLSGDLVPLLKRAGALWL